MNPENCTPLREANAVGKKAYCAPKLVEYGSVAKLTQNGGATVTDNDNHLIAACL